MTNNIQGKFNSLRTDLRGQFMERDREIDGLLAAMVAGENVLLLGPPGTGKSAMIRSAAGAFDARYFQRLLTRYSTPEELFGPISIQGMKDDRYTRVTRAKLPEAEIAFIDEIFKGNSSILNALLGILNEREFDNDAPNGQPIKVPLRTLVGASNELPEDEEVLGALYDRFLFRFWCGYLVDRDNRMRLLTGNMGGAIKARVSVVDLDQARMDVGNVGMDADHMDMLLNVLDKLAGEGFSVSDRRVAKLPRALRAWAWVQLDAAVSADTICDCLPDLIWREPKDRAAVARIVGHEANPIAGKAQEIVDAAKELETKLPEQNQRAAYLAAAAQANSELGKMATTLRGLDPTGKNRRVAEAIKTVNAVQDRVSRQATAIFKTNSTTR